MKETDLALAQISAQLGKPEENTIKILSFMEEARGKNADLLVFPECSLTGYAPDKAADLAVFSDAAASACAARIRQRAAVLGIAVCFGYMEKSGEKYYISQELCVPSGKSECDVTVYRKTHLGSKESVFLSAGNDFPTPKVRVSVGEILTGMQLCWESHIPQISSVYRACGAELLLFPYASGMSGEKCRENWSVHLPARASDNGCFAAACNLILPGDEGGSPKGGGLAVWDPKGKLICGCWDTEVKLMLCRIGGRLPRDKHPEDMHNISYFDRVRKELF